MRDNAEVNRPKTCTSLVILCQWWVILFLALTVELVLTLVSTFSADSVFHQDPPEHGVNGLLRYLSILCVPACGVTYFLGLTGIILQVNAARKDAASLNCRWHYDLRYTLPYARDVACQVLFMPMLYHIMMCRAVIRQWSVISGEFTDDIRNMPLNATGQANLELQAVEADYGVAEMYDAYALWCFGNLGMAVVERSYRTQENLEDMVSLIRAGILFGVQAYVIVAVASGFYSNAMSLANVMQGADLCGESVGQTDSGGGFCTFGNIFYGADFATSTIAIYNLFSFEHKLWKPLQEFNPGWKFWSMKIPVSLGFAGVLCLNMSKPFTHLSSDQVTLVDALTRALVMPLVALLNLYAWRPGEVWYSWDDIRDDGQHGSLHNPFDSGSVVANGGSELLAAQQHT